jgi:8-oxo-dGTP pyrophosphatase MutT (NUDIX family)
LSAKININNYALKLGEMLHNGLPGIAAQEIMAPSNRKELIVLNNHGKTARTSSVLIILFPNEAGELCTIFTKRVEYKGVHSGQISFPGGKSEPEDKSLLHTALRETAEEIGLHINEKSILGRLTDLFVPPSNFIISPFVALLDAPPLMKPDPTEVAEIFSVPVLHCLAPESTIYQSYTTSFGQDIPVPGYLYRDYFIWGATAMIYSELLWVIRQIECPVL